MKQMVLTSLFLLYGALGSLGLVAHNETSEQLIGSDTGTNTTNQGHLSERLHPEGPQANVSIATEPRVEKSKALPRILYVTNRTTDFVKRTQTLERRTAPSGLAVSTQGNRRQGGIGQKPSFETARGKNWCAYVHTQLFPTVVVDATASYLPIGTDPCNWSRGGCARRSQATSRPTYRIKHKITTSLEWKCCPGYLGPDCQPGAVKTTQLYQADEAEGRPAGGPVRQTASAGRQQVAVESVENRETADFKRQTEKILTLQKQMTNVTENMGSVRRSLVSLQEKLGTKEINDAQTHLAALKSKAVREILRDVVQEQIEESQRTMKETISVIFKTVSALSVDLQATRANLQQINGTVAQLLSCHTTREDSNKQMQRDIQSLKNEISSLRDNAVTYANKTAHLFQKYGSLEVSLEQQKTIQLLNSMNRTVSQTHHVEANGLEGAQPNRTEAPEEHEAVAFRRQMSILGDTISSQARSVLQLQQELHAQEMRMANLSSMVGRQRRLADTTFETLAAHCKKELVPRLKEMQGRIDDVNRTLFDKARPVELAVSAIEDRISHMSYDLEELKPLIEGQRFSDVIRNDTRQVSPIESRVENLAATVEVLNRSLINLEKTQDRRANKTQEQEKQVKETFRGCQDGIEDALNDTMTVINRAIDSVKDDYYVLRTDFEFTDKKLRKISDDFSERLKSLIGLKVEIDLLNSTVLSMQSKMEAFDVISNASNMPFVSVPKNTEGTLLNFTRPSQKLGDVLAQLAEHQRATSHSRPANSNNDFGRYRLQVESPEVKQNAPDANVALAAKSKKPKLTVETSLALKYKDLDKRMQALVIQTSNLTQEVLRLRVSNSRTQQSCRNVSAALVQMQAGIPPIFQELVNLTILHRDLSHFLVPEREAQNASALSPVTSVLNHVLKDVSQLQKQTLKLERTLDDMLSLNSTLPAGWNQRHTDNVFNEVESTGCPAGRCRNGGTCVDVRAGYICVCRFPFAGPDCGERPAGSEAPSPDFLQGSYRYAPAVTFFVAHTYAMNEPGPVRFNQLYVNYGAAYAPGSGKFAVPYLGVYVFTYTVESSSPDLSGYLVVDEEDKISFQAQDLASQHSSTRIVSGDAVLELNFGQRVWLRLETGHIPARYPPITTFSGYLLYRT
ncbi:multimerin-1 isoform X1 [Arapaima gigas]